MFCTLQNELYQVPHILIHWTKKKTKKKDKITIKIEFSNLTSQSRDKSFGFVDYGNTNQQSKMKSEEKSIFSKYSKINYNKKKLKKRIYIKKKESIRKIKKLKTNKDLYRWPRLLQYTTNNIDWTYDERLKQ